MGVLIVNSQNLGGGGGVFVESVILPKRFIIRYRGLKGFATCKGSFQLCTLLGGLSIPKSECTAIEIVSSLARLASLFDRLAEIFVSTREQGCV